MSDDEVCNYDEVFIRILEDGYQLCLKTILEDKDKDLVKRLMELVPMYRNIFTLTLQHRMENGGVFDKFINTKALKIFDKVSKMDTDTIEMILKDFINLVGVTIETFENVDNDREVRTPVPDHIRESDPDRKFYITDFIGGNYCFDIGERIVDVYVCDDTRERTKFYRSVAAFQKEMGVELNEEYLKQVLPEILFENYLRIKEKYLHNLTLGDSYDQSDNFLAFFEAEATAMRAYLLKVTQLMYARGHLFNEPIPYRLSTEIYKYCPRNEEDDRSPGEGWDHYHRDVGRVLMNIPNRYTELDDDE